MLLYANVCSILDGDLVALCYAVCSMECEGSYETIVLGHLAPNAAGLTGGQVTVVALLQVDANFGCGLHLELVHGLTSLGDILLIAILVAHNISLLCFPQGWFYPLRIFHVWSIAEEKGNSSIGAINKFLIAPVARNDLLDIKEYISMHIRNPSAAASTINGDHDEDV